LGSHDHLVVEGCLREMFEQVQSLVEEEAFRTPRVIMSIIVLAVNKTFLSEHLLNEDE
jgi:hypothetical protein